jgi:hypothetical protein
MIFSTLKTLNFYTALTGSLRYEASNNLKNTDNTLANINWLPSSLCRFSKIYILLWSNSLGIWKFIMKLVETIWQIPIIRVWFIIISVLYTNYLSTIPQEIQLWIAHITNQLFIMSEFLHATPHLWCKSSQILKKIIR